MEGSEGGVMGNCVDWVEWVMRLIIQLVLFLSIYDFTTGQAPCVLPNIYCQKCANLIFDRKCSMVLMSVK